MATATILYLFDIDGTLLRADGAGGRAFERALVERFGLVDAARGVRFGGKTDPAILDEILVARRGDAASVVEREQFLACYLPLLEQELTRSPGFRVLPGVIDALDFFEDDGAVGIGVATGNVAAGARAKLTRARLDQRFAFGGYGCDSALRAELVARAIERGRALHPHATDVVVVGDTVHDIAAARACDAVAVAVTTGADEAGALGAADVVLTSMTGLPAWHAARFSA